MQQDPAFNQGNLGFQQPLPNATIVLILGILSIVFCCCYGLGLVLGIIALVLAGKDRARYRSSPGSYTLGSYNNLNAGRVCAIIGTILSALLVIYMIWLIAILGIEALSDPTLMQERMKDMID